MGLKEVSSMSDKELKEIQAAAAADAKGILADAASTASDMTMNAQTEAYMVLAAKTGLTPANGLSQYILLTEL